MRGELVPASRNGKKAALTAAVVVDDKGDTKFYVVPTKLAITWVIVVLLVVGVTCALGVVVLFMHTEVDRMQKDIKQDIVNTNTAH